MDQICCICKETLRYYLTGEDFLYQTTTKKFSIYKCGTCGLERILPLPSEDEVAGFYPTSYYSYNIRKKKGALTLVKETLVLGIHTTKSRVIRNFYMLIQKFFLNSGFPHSVYGSGNFLDIGCGDGTDIELAKNIGWNSYGFEIGTPGQKGTIIYGENFQSADYGNKTFDYIRIWHTLEHVSDPVTFLQRAYDMLNPNGRIAISVPNTRSLYAGVFKTYWFHRDVPRHLNNFNDKNLPLLLEQIGFQKITVQYQGLNGLTGSLQHVIYKLMSIRIELSSNALMILLCIPLELLLSVIKKSDIIIVTSEKSNYS